RPIPAEDGIREGQAVTQELGERLPGERVPETRRPVVARGQDRLSLGAEAYRRHTVEVSQRRAELGSGAEGPALARPVVARGGGPSGLKERWRIVPPCRRRGQTSTAVATSHTRANPSEVPAATRSPFGEKNTCTGAPSTGIGSPIQRRSRASPIRTV